MRKTAFLLFLSCCSLLITRAQITFTQEDLFSSVNIPYLVGAADLDGDQDNDVLLSRRGNSTFGVSVSSIRWFEQTAEGLTERDVIYSNVNGGGVSTSQLFLAEDVDGDEDNDVLIMERISGIGTIASLFWMENNNGIFSQKANIAVQSPSSEILFRAFNMDADENTDLLLYNVDAMFVEWYEFADTGFVLKTPLPTVSIKGLITADLNDDGLDDLIIIQEDKMVWHENLDGIEFSTFKLVDPNTIGAFDELAAVDFDGDGDVDIIALDHDLGIFLYENDGEAGFGDVRLLFAFAVPGVSEMDLKDIDRDGDPDIILFNPGEELIWIENDGDLPLQSKHTISTLYDASVNVLGADLSSDGNIDVLTASINAGNMHWFRHDGDTIAPDVQCRDQVAVSLDADGSAQLSPGAVDSSSTDNNAIDSLSLDLSSFDCDDLGNVVAVLTAVDYFGNSSSCNTTVQVMDNIAPEIECNDLTIEINNTTGDPVTVDVGEIASASDNCSPIDLTPVTILFSSGQAGDNSVTVTVTDGARNTATCVSTVTVDITTGVLEQQYGIAAQLSPNPARAFTSLQLSAALPFHYDLSIWDAGGRNVATHRKQFGSTVTMDTRELAAGQYFIRMTESETGKLLGVYPLMLK